MRDILFYHTASGRCPVQEYLDTLATAKAQKIWSVLDVVRTSERVHRKFLKKLKDTDGLWEVRACSGRDEFRLLGFFDGGRLIVLVSAFAKKTEEVPPHEIDIAQRRRRDYRERNSSNG